MRSTEKVPVIDIYHGVEVVDEYRWLEDWSDPSVRSWSDAQNAYARGVLDHLPAVEALTARITEIEEATSASYYMLAWQGGKLFAAKRQPPLEQPLIVVMRSADEPELERVILDPSTLDPSGTTTFDWFEPSPDGQLVAVSLSVGGAERGGVHIYETATGDEVGRVIEGVEGAIGGQIAWLTDGSGFYYTRYPRPDERPPEDLEFYQQVWFHQIGTPIESDRYVIGEDFPRIAQITLQADHRSDRLLVVVQYGDSDRLAFYLIEPDGTRTQVAAYGDQIVQAVFGPDDKLFLISRQDAPRGKVLRLSLAEPILEKAETIIPECSDALVVDFGGQSRMVATQGLLYLTYQLGGPSEIRVFDHMGRRQPGPALLPVSDVGEIVALDDGEILYWNVSYTDPPAWYRFDPKEGTTHKTSLVTESPVDFSDTEVVREYATSIDGTQIPVNILRRTGTKVDGSNPVLLTGYGGYGISIAPYFRPVIRVWIEQGGVFAEVNIRGGGEFGEEWHRSGMTTSKQNCFDDFAAAMQHMIDVGYTCSERLAIRGGSNGGLLMGAMITQHSDLFRAVVSSVGIYDMLRSELTPNGTYNVPEYGTVVDPEQFRALYAYSPYHNARDGTAYPSTLFMTGANDRRVDPMHSRKMTARLQAATSSDAPILLRTSSSTGHGIGTPLSERIRESVDMYAFLFHELGIDYEPIAQPTE